MVSAQSDALERTLREVCEQLAPLDTTPCSPGERVAAEWIAGRLRSAAVADVALEDEPCWGGFPRPWSILGECSDAAPCWCSERRSPGSLLALVSSPACSTRPRTGRGSCGGRCAAAVDGQRGRAGRRSRCAPGRSCCSPTTTPPRPAACSTRPCRRRSNARFPGLAAPVQDPATHMVDRRRGSRFVAGLSPPVRRRARHRGARHRRFAMSIIADMMRSPTVPGANDNLSASPPRRGRRAAPRPADPGTAGLLLSAGAEETLQDGIRGFIARHRRSSTPDRTWILNFDAIGSPRLIMIEGEGRSGCRSTPTPLP